MCDRERLQRKLPGQQENGAAARCRRAQRQLGLLQKSLSTLLPGRVPGCGVMALYCCQTALCILLPKWVVLIYCGQTNYTFNKIQNPKKYSCKTFQVYRPIKELIVQNFRSSSATDELICWVLQSCCSSLFVYAFYVASFQLLLFES